MWRWTKRITFGATALFGVLALSGATFQWLATRRDLAAALDELGQAAHVHHAGGGVLLGQPPGVAQPGVVVRGERALALVPVDPRLVRDLL